MFFRSSSPSFPPPPGARSASAPATVGTIPAAGVASTPPVEGPSRGRILVVDDSALIRSTVARALIQNRYEVIQAENGRLGLESWEKNQAEINLVLSDVFMPEMDGISMAKGIRQRSQAVPILLMSSKLDEDTRWVAEEAGFRLLPKPFKDEVLLAVIDRLIRTVPAA